MFKKTPKIKKLNSQKLVKVCHFILHVKVIQIGRVINLPPKDNMETTSLIFIVESLLNLVI